VLSIRGAVLALGAACAAITGLVYGVEEFVFLAMSVAVLLVLGAATAWYRQHVSRRALRVVVRVPHPEVTARQSASVELTLSNVGRRRLPPVLVEDPGAHWSVSHPGLGEGSLAHTGRNTGRNTARTTARPTSVAHGFPALGGRAGAVGWLGGPRPSRRDRARDRRTLGAARRLPELGPGRETVVSAPVPTESRGLLTLSDLGVWCGDPFGLVAFRITVAPPAHVIVYPVPAEVVHHRRADAGAPGARARPPAWGRTTGLSGDELSGLRPYAPGDRLTRLHWPSLARSGELVVREFLEAQAGSLVLLVDLRPSVHHGDSLEATIGRAAGCGLAALDRGLTVELCTSTGDRLVITPDGTGRQSMLRALALLGTASAPPAVVRRWGSRPTGGAVWATGRALGEDVVLVTTATGATEPSLPDAVGRRAQTVLG
jgi:uncharacterized protein (DUF58 family)